MDNKIKEFKLDTNDPAFTLMNSELNTALDFLARRMIQNKNSSAALTLKIGLTRIGDEDPVDGSEINKLDIDYKISTQITEKASVDGDLNLDRKWKAEVKKSGVYLHRIEDPQRTIYDYQKGGK